MNELVNEFLLVAHKFIFEMHLRQHEFTYSACESCTKQKVRKLKIQGDSKYICQNELDKVCFQHNMAYGDFKNLSRWIVLDKVLHGKAFNIAEYPKYDEQYL